ncbi:MAG: hypothetical protein H0W68_04840 [Gemmatimonadaceae bacterium]|nr:hypothetical protein [Gemmatimonadaceae bacterium]
MTVGVTVDEPASGRDHRGMQTFAIVVFGVFIGGASCASDSGGSDAPPAAPTSLAVERLGGGGHLTWADNSDDEEEFMIMRKDGTAAYVELGRVPFRGPE